ncbi:MAG: RNA-binding transcriptional accessory protein [Clostridia bacterium]|nr:RNA-binding transcriptional accessory protein [Clostridia bacterium]
MNIIEILAKELNVDAWKVEKAIELLDAGNTVPFISRYRKEVTGSLDDACLRRLEERLTSLRNLEKRKEEVREQIASQGKLTEEIEAAIENAVTVTEVEDIYRPFKPHRKTRADAAREKGLDGFAALLMEQRKRYEPALEVQAEAYLSEEKGVLTVEDVFAGASDIIAESISDNAAYRKEIRETTVKFGVLKTKKASDEVDPDGVFMQYYESAERISKIPSHRILAINRGEKTGVLKVSLEMDETLILNYLLNEVIRVYNSPAKPYIVAAMTDGYRRLIAPSVANEVRAMRFDIAAEGAIALFSDNLRHLLMQAPLKGKTVLGFDPGYRTGCKLAVVDKTGKVLDTAVIYPTLGSERSVEEAKRIVKRLVATYHVDVISIGNGTASKESEIFISNLLKEISAPVKYIITSEAGASVYSASELGAEEFPDFDVTQRSAVSIARRLQDPLAELVKIDPKSIGVGQYQHDMKPAQLDLALTGVVEDCVNAVGVDLNTASWRLLSYIAGINATGAKNIVRYREENGEFQTRAQVLKVPRIGAKAYEQCAGFLRVSGSPEVLDITGVHPESYTAAKALLAHFGYTEEDVRAGKINDLSKKVQTEGNAAVAALLGIGEPTLLDMICELEKPGRDVRDTLPPPILRENLLSLEDLEVGMVLDGTVRNVTDFGAFVDIGVHQDGLVHISELSNKFVRHPSGVVSTGDAVEVRVISLDVKRKRIGLSMKNVAGS